MSKARKPLRGKDLLHLISTAALDKKAEDIVVLNLRGETGIADFFVICQGDNPLHNRAIRDNIVSELEASGITPWHTEGESEGRWILMDYSDVIVHVMTEQVRDYYALEELWRPVDAAEPQRPSNV